MIQPGFPFAAVVGQTPLKRALLLNGIDPEVGGVLVKGPRGTGKSTLARSLARLLPRQRYAEGCPYRCRPGDDFDCPHCGEDPPEETAGRPRFVDLPLGATEDQLLGTLDVESAVREGTRRFQPGLLARAHRGILYVDEVNLLPDRLVDLLLDAAASGVNRVEREGISFRHPARFTLIGSMNPEEGDLRPQLRDRFGLCATSETLTEPDRRTELARRVGAFRDDPSAFRDRWRTEQQSLRADVASARRRMPDVALDADQERWIARRTLERGVEGHRADIVIRRAARALAALRGRSSPHKEDLEQAATLALRHRRPDPSGPRPPEGRADTDPFGSSEENGTDGDSTSDAEQVQPPRPTDALPEAPPKGDPGGAGRTSRGSRLGSRPVARERKHRFDLDRTLLASVRRSLRRRSPWGLQPEDLRYQTPTRPPHHAVFLLDTSGSMSRKHAIAYIKGAVRNRVRSPLQEEWFSLVEFRRSGGRVVIGPTRRARRLLGSLEELPVGGRTPMAEGVSRCRQLLGSSGSPVQGGRSSVYVCSDGRVSVTPELIAALCRLGRQSRLWFVDAERGPVRWGCMRQLARRTGGSYLSLRTEAA